MPQVTALFTYGDDITATVRGCAEPEQTHEQTRHQ